MIVTMLTVLYNIFIQPLIYIYHVLFVLLYGLIEDPMLSIIALSIVINFLVLPLYWKADQIQREEQDKQKRMKPWLNHIRRNFSGDERFLMQSAYYKVEQYNLLSILMEAGPLALQIPFFMAAFRYISNIKLLEGAAFGPIGNLLAPDSLITIGEVPINILPIIMTVINFASGYIYSKGKSLRLRIQTYGIGILFLILLYNSASGLVIYWITNQVFSLCKNIYFLNKGRLSELFPVFAAITVIIWVIIETVCKRVDAPVDVFLTECLLVSSTAVLVMRVLKEKHVKKPAIFNRISILVEPRLKDKLIMPLLFIETCLLLLQGVYIPTSVIASSATEFIDSSTNVFNTGLITYPFTVYFGFFLVWMTVIILSRDRKQQCIIVAGLWVFLSIAIVNQFLFDPHIGFLYSDLTFEGTLRFSLLRHIGNLLVCAVVGVFFLVVFVKRPLWVKNMAGILSIALIILSLKNIITIVTAEKKIQNSESVVSNLEGILNFSKNGKNVVVLMLDRAIGGYIPFIFDEKPELKKTYSGFVYYPDTVSFGEYTNFGTPALFGGYEYTPEEINKRSEETLAKKHNEALCVMPVLFQENGFHVTVCDPPYAGYASPPDLSIYDKYNNIHAYNLIGKSTSRFNHIVKDNIYANQENNFVMYSLYRILPLFMKPYIYADGTYLLEESNSLTEAFINAYASLYEFPKLTMAHDNNQNYFMVLQNNITHEPTALSPPDYTVKMGADDSDAKDYAGEYAYHDLTVDGKTMINDSPSDWEHYCVNIAAYQLVGVWLDYLKDLGVYDNTRIIIVADHGRDLGQFEDLIHPDGLDIEFVWPVLMVKDFESKGDVETNTEFMTNADVPILATKGLIENPLNPFTGNPLKNNSKKTGNLKILDSNNFKLSGGNSFDLRHSSWWSVHDSIFNLDNWEKIGGGSGQ